MDNNKSRCYFPETSRPTFAQHVTLSEGVRGLCQQAAERVGDRASGSCPRPGARLTDNLSIASRCGFMRREIRRLSIASCQTSCHDCRYAHVYERKIEPKSDIIHNVLCYWQNVIVEETREQIPFKNAARKKMWKKKT